MAGKFRWYAPVRPFHINQHWGENEACVINFGEKDQKIAGKVNGVCPVGYEELYPLFNMQGHNGLDLRAGVQEVFAAAAGVVIEKQVVPARGLGLGILTNEKYDFGKYGEHYIKLRYWHLKSFNVEIGDTVEIGTLLGFTDNTGYSAGNHLHFEGQLMDKDAGGHPTFFNTVDMIAGTIDIEPYYAQIHADNYTKIIPLYQRLIPALQALVAELQKKYA